MRKSAANLAWQFALLLAIAYAIIGIRPGQVSGTSMEPRIASGDLVVIDALAFRFGRPARGDVIAFRHERSAPTVYLKRVIGIPGDRIAIVRGIVSVNGRPLDEPYVRHDGRDFAPLVVAAGAYFVLGDNRPNSDDSRAWGAVPASAVLGRAACIAWPLGHLRVIR